MFSYLLRLVAAHQLIALAITLVSMYVSWKTLRYTSRVFGDEDYSPRTWFWSLVPPMASGLLAGLLGVMFLITLLPR